MSKSSGLSGLHAAPECGRAKFDPGMTDKTNTIAAVPESLFRLFTLFQIILGAPMCSPMKHWDSKLWFILV